VEARPRAALDEAEGMVLQGLKAMGEGFEQQEREGWRGRDRRKGPVWGLAEAVGDDEGEARGGEGGPS
jgi:hypothetical protein